MFKLCVFYAQDQSKTFPCLINDLFFLLRTIDLLNTQIYFLLKSRFYEFWQGLTVRQKRLTRKYLFPAACILPSIAYLNYILQANIWITDVKTQRIKPAISYTSEIDQPEPEYYSKKNIFII